MKTDSTAIAILLITFLVLILLRVYIAYAVGIASVACLLYLGIPLSNVCQQMVKGLNSFMAVPFFIVMGCLMGKGEYRKSSSPWPIPWLAGCGEDWLW